MKIHQLENGARFEFEGETYIKTGPLFATGKNGPRLIPKYAVLKPLGETTASTHRMTEALLTKASVLSAFDAFFADCLALVEEDRRSALSTSRDRFLKSINGES